MENLVFATETVKNHINPKPPVIIVGLPRSGSSFLSDVLSQIEDWYVFDDLYLYREAAAIDAIAKPLNIEQLEKLIYFLGWQIRSRIIFCNYSIPNITLEQVDLLDQSLLETFRNEQIYWYELLEEWMLRLACSMNCSNWGYKAPQDFMISSMLKNCFPGVKFIFIQRDPRDMMRSLKFVNSNDGDPKQYHPIAYSLYWRRAQLSLVEMRENDLEVLKIRFEELVENPDVIAEKIAVFLGSQITEKIIVKQSNTSFSDNKREELLSTEIWIIEKILGDSLINSGYSMSCKNFRISEVPSIILISIKFIFYQLKRVFKNKSALISIKNFLREIRSN